MGVQPAGLTVDVPLVQGSYLLMGGETLSPKVVMDAATLTEIRTPAVSVATSAGEPVVVDRQLRADATVLAVGRTLWTRGSCMRMCCAE